MILNLHGLYGNCKNTNYGILTESYPSSEIYSPQIEYERRSPNGIIEELSQAKAIRLIVGNSFGGFYAYVLSGRLGIPCVLTNPCIPPAKYLKQLLPEYPAEYLTELQELTERACAKKFQEKTCNTFVILGKKDEVLDAAFTKSYLKNVQVYELDGGHKLSGTEYKNLFMELIGKADAGV